MALNGLASLAARLDKIEARLSPPETYQLRINLIAVGDPVPEGSIALSPLGSFEFQAPDTPPADGLNAVVPELSPSDPGQGTASASQERTEAGRAIPEGVRHIPVPTRRLRVEPDPNEGLWAPDREALW
jgi:hypothetical protein